MEVAQAEKDARETEKKDAEEPESIALEAYKAQEEAEKKRQELERKEKEAIEAEEAFEQLDEDQDGLITMSEIIQKKSFDTNRDGEVSEEEAKVSILLILLLHIIL